MGLNKFKTFRAAAARALSTLAVPQLARQDAANTECKLEAMGLAGTPGPSPAPPETTEREHLSGGAPQAISDHVQ